MDKCEQRVVIKFLFLKGFGNKLIHKELLDVCHEDAYSISQVKRWIARFKGGDLSCTDEEREGRPLSNLGESISDFLNRFPFASARRISTYFHTNHHTVKEILERELGLRKFTRKWVPHFLTLEQKKKRVTHAKGILRELREDKKNHYANICTGDESWFFWSYQSDSMFAESKEKVETRTKHTIGSKKTMITIFFTGVKLIILDDSPKEMRFNQEYFLLYIGPLLAAQHRETERKNDGCTFKIHMDNSLCHNGRKVTDFFVKKGLYRITHPPYSPDISPCDFWFFGKAKKQLEDMVFMDSNSLIEKIYSIWDDISFEELQSVYENWAERLQWIIDHKGEYYSH